MGNEPAERRRLWSPLASEYVLADLLGWQEAGLAAALVTLVGIDGTTPRPLGAQMAVAADGRWTGYLSGGCIEHAVAIEAKRVIETRRNLLVRYGKGSKYVDIKLPCGSGLDLYIDCGLDARLLREAASLRKQRTPFVLASRLSSGENWIETCTTIPATAMGGGVFQRGYMPDLKVLVLGNGPAVAALAHAASTAGLVTQTATSGESTRRELEAAGLESISVEDALAALPSGAADRWTAAVLAFHEHDLEGPLLHQLLATDCFYIGALGSRAAQRQRAAALTALGHSAGDIERVRGPIGLIAGAKSRGLLAAGVVAEILDVAKAQQLIV